MLVTYTEGEIKIGSIKYNAELKIIRVSTKSPFPQYSFEKTKTGHKIRLESSIDTPIEELNDSIFSTLINIKIHDGHEIYCSKDEEFELEFFIKANRNIKNKWIKAKGRRFYG